MRDSVAGIVDRVQHLRQEKRHEIGRRHALVVPQVVMAINDRAVGIERRLFGRGRIYLWRARHGLPPVLLCAPLRIETYAHATSGRSPSYLIDQRIDVAHSREPCRVLIDINDGHPGATIL
jgi:hypothetical protein